MRSVLTSIEEATEMTACTSTLYQIKAPQIMELNMEEARTFSAHSTQKKPFRLLLPSRSDF
jgi:hypothetical protein